MTHIVCDTPEKIDMFRFLAVKSALKLEIKGLQANRGRRPTLQIANEMMGTNYRRKQQAFDAMQVIVDSMKKNA